MKKKPTALPELVLLKWAALFALVFCLALPVTATLCKASTDTYRVSVSSGYLALRSEKSYNSSNETGQLYSGDTVTVCDYSDNAYWYVYSSKLDKYGYVNKDYLVSTDSGSSAPSWTVSVDKGYLALRSAKKYDSSNEIGQLYSGDTVQLLNSDDNAYWYVYSSKLGKSGYVNKDYLYGGSNSNCRETRTVSVVTGYLALRNAKKYDSSNEIGQLYTGDTVEILDSDGKNYWYVYSSKLNKCGYVNKDYLAGGPNADIRTVHVKKGYLALRNAKKYDSSNEIGQLYSGDTVEVLDSDGKNYWRVYSSELNKSGFVNKDYLY